MTWTATVRVGKAKRHLRVSGDGETLRKGQHVVVRTDRGTEIATLVDDPAAGVGAPDPEVETAALVRAATGDDVDRANALLEHDETDAFRVFRDRVEALGLPMKPIQAEVLFGGERIVLHFTSERRVDFRELVRDLSRRLPQKVELRRIPPREAAAMKGGVGVCGRELCCATWLKVLDPVTTKMARDQGRPVTGDANLGACGRLRCCLRYELDAYRGSGGGGCSGCAVKKQGRAGESKGEQGRGR